jgi:hypothetical protein
MILFTAHLTTADSHHHIDYESIDACLSDQPLADLLNSGEATIVLWAGSLRLTGKPLRSSNELHEALASNAPTILRRKSRS